MSESSAESPTPGTVLAVAPAWGELLNMFVRAQDSDLRLLALVDEHAESEHERDARLTREVRSRFPSLDESLISKWVSRATQFQRRYQSDSGELDDFGAAAFRQARDLARDLGLRELDVGFVWHLFRASADDPDRARMLGVALIGVLSSFEGWLHSAARFAARLDAPRPVAGAPIEPPYPKEFDLITIRDHEDAIDDRVWKALLSGWPDWQNRLGRDFGLVLPAQPESVRLAYELRRYAAHRGGFLQFSTGADGEIFVESPVTPDDIRAVADDLLLVAADVAFAAMWATNGVSRADQWTRLSNFRFELLSRHRYDVCARTGHLDPRGKADWTERRGADVNLWIALDRLGRRSEYMRGLASWPVKLEGTIYEVIRDVLRGRVASAARRAERLRAAGMLKDDAWLTWPVFDDIRPAPNGNGE